MKLNGLEKYFKTVNGEIIDLKQVDSDGLTPLIITLINNQLLNLNVEQFDYLIKNSDLSLLKYQDHLMKLKKIQSELLSDEILYKIDMKEIKNKLNKI